MATITAQTLEVTRLQAENDQLTAEVDRLRKIVAELSRELPETMIDAADSKYDLELAVADRSMHSLSYNLDDIEGWEVKAGEYTVKVDGASLECEAAIDCEGFGRESAGVRFDARLVGLVFEVSN